MTNEGMKILDGVYRDWGDPAGIYRDVDGSVLDGTKEPLRTQIHEAYAQRMKAEYGRIEERMAEEEEFKRRLRLCMANLMEGFLHDTGYLPTKAGGIEDSGMAEDYNDILELIDDYDAF